MIDKNLLIVIENGFTARSFLRTDFLEKVKLEFEQVFIACPDVKMALYKELYESDNVKVVEIKEMPETFFQRKLFSLLKFSIPTKQIRLRIMRCFFWPNGFHFGPWFFYFPFVFLSWALGHFKFWRLFLRRLYSSSKTDELCRQLLKEYEIDIVFANYTGIAVRNFNLKLITAAKRAGILTVGNIASWDQLSSKVFITEHTDFVFAPNEEVKEEAIKIGDFKENQIKVVGLPHFDFYFKKEFLFSKEEFFKKIGADLTKKLILFTGSLASFRVDYQHYLEMLDEFTKNHPDVQIYFRPHPKANFSHNLKGKFQDNPAFIFERDKEMNFKGNFEIVEGDEQFLFNLIFHCDLMISFFSTILVEACLLDKPIINPIYYTDKKQNYFYRPEIDLKQREHLERVFQFNFCFMSKNKQEFFAAICEGLANPGLHSAERKIISQRQAYILDGASAVKMAGALTDIVKINFSL